MGNKKILINIDNHIAYVYLNEPESLNALSLLLKKSLLLELEKLRKKNDVQIIVLSGRGRSFCSGGDIKSMTGTYNSLNVKQEMSISNQIIETIRCMPQLVIAAVHGYAAGAGMSLALATDLVFAEKGAEFILSFKNIGLIPDLGLHYHLTKQVGPWKAKEWIWSGKTLTAKEAVKYGIVTEEVEQGCLINRVTEYINFLLKGSFEAYTESKRIINNVETLSMEKVLEQESNIQSLLRVSEAHEVALNKLLNRDNKNKE